MFSRRGKVSWLRLVGEVLLLVILGGLIVSVAGSSQEIQVAVYAMDDDVLFFWDPSNIYSNEGFWIVPNVYEALLTYDYQTGEVKPWLATHYEKSADGLTWTFELRRGVKFHTGKEMDAAAVKACIERTIEGGMGGSYNLPSMQIDVASKYTVVFHLENPASLDLLAATSVTSGMLIFDPEPAHDWYKEGNDSGTGPYMVESHKGVEEVILTRFNDYWRGWEGKHFDKVAIKKVTEISTRIMMVEGGTADFATGLPPTEAKRLEGNPDVDIIPVDSWHNMLVMFNTQKGVLKSRLVRHALAYAIPYEKVIEALGGYGRQSRGIVPHTLWGYSDRVMQYKYSLVTAKELLKAAGYPDGGFTLGILYLTGSEEERKLAELWKAELAQLGINLETKAVTWGIMVSTATHEDPSKRHDICLFHWWPDYADPASFFEGMFVTGGIDNFAYYSNPVFDDLVKAAKRISGIDREAAADLYAEAQNLLMADIPGEAYLDIKMLQIKRASLKGYVPIPLMPQLVLWYNCYREE